MTRAAQPAANDAQNVTGGKPVRLETLRQPDEKPPTDRRTYDLIWRPQDKKRINAFALTRLDII